MISLVVLLILVATFALLAVRNWKKTIGAGPTILIVGFIVVSSFGAIKWVDYQKQLRDYDTCHSRVDRSIESFRFNNTLVRIIEREIADRPDISKELRDAMLQPLKPEMCGKEPTFMEDYINN